MTPLRRQFCQSLASLMGMLGLSGCIPSGSARPSLPPKVYTDEEQRRLHKFRGIGGYELFISGFGKGDTGGVFADIRDEFGNYIQTGNFRESRDTKSSKSLPPTGMYKSILVILYDPNQSRRVSTTGTRKDFEGVVWGEWTVPIADRIPDELLDDLRRDPKGTLRIKIRLHREGVLLGWDIERRPGFDPKKRDSFGEIAYVSPGWVKTGGDFKEARGVYWLEDESGNLVRAPRPETLGGVMPPELARRGIVFNRHGFLREKGWYIHPKTGQRIETDF